jgi:hypothetical protein
MFGKFEKITPSEYRNKRLEKIEKWEKYETDEYKFS